MVCGFYEVDRVHVKGLLCQIVVARTGGIRESRRNTLACNSAHIIHHFYYSVNHKYRTHSDTMVHMNKVPQFLKKKAVYLPIAAVILIFGASSVYSMFNKPEYQTAQVERSEFSNIVSVTGKVVAANDVSLAFETGGRVASITAKVGDKVTQGTVLARTNSGDQYASYLVQQARLSSAEAQLAEARRGTRPTELQNLKNNEARAFEDLRQAIQDAYVTSDDVLRSNVDVMFTNPTGPYPRFFSFDDVSRREKIEKMRLEVGDMIDEWQKSTPSLQSSAYSDSYRNEAQENLQTMKAFLDLLGEASSYFKNADQLSDTVRTQYINGISAGRASISSAISSLNASYKAYINAQDALELSAEGSTPEEIARAEADVRSAQANLLQAQASLSKTTIVAPFDGLITKVDLKVGEQVMSGSPVISMISNANFEIESYIPEADIASIHVGDVGTTTLDAYGESVQFGVVVTGIDLSETEVDGVATYKTMLQFFIQDERIRSGMTANIDVVSETRQGVLSIPQSAVISKDGKRMVLIKDMNGNVEEKNIKTGSVDTNGNIEIINGVSEGDTIITNPPK